jgi:hypothetical protein
VKSLWKPLYQLLHLFLGNRLRPVTERAGSQSFGWTVIDFRMAERRTILISGSSDPSLDGIYYGWA